MIDISAAVARNADWNPYCAWLLKRARSWQPGTLECARAAYERARRERVRFRDQRCYGNAERLHLAAGDGFAYCEGYAATPELQAFGQAVRHALVVTGEGFVIDPTWCRREAVDPRSLYWGVRLAPADVARAFNAPRAAWKGSAGATLAGSSAPHGLGLEEATG